MANSSNVLTFSLGLLIVVGFVFAAIGISFYMEKGRAPDHSTRQLHFAAVTLTGLGMLFALSMAMYYWAQEGSKEAGKELFDGCKTVIPPIITLILGYYFGSKNEGTSVPRPLGSSSPTAPLPQSFSMAPMSAASPASDAPSSRELTSVAI